MSVWPCPDCPECGHPPQLHFGGSQAFCGSDGCRVVSWERSLTRAQNMEGAQGVNLDGLS